MITYYTKEGKFEAIGYFEIPYKNLHRLDGPAAIYQNGRKEWWQNGKLHRIDGPAVEWKNGSKYWYINDKELNAEEVEAWIKNNNINLKDKSGRALFMLRFW